MRVIFVIVRSVPLLCPPRDMSPPIRIATGHRTKADYNVSIVSARRQNVRTPCSKNLFEKKIIIIKLFYECSYIL